MTIHLEDIGKEYSYHWIFRHLDYVLSPGKIYAIGGPNGSGKSTLLQIISGFLSPSQGKVSYEQNGIVVDPSLYYQYVSLAAPYVDLPEELSLQEFINFHFQFKKSRFQNGCEEALDLMDLLPSRHKFIKNFSSGMKQRARLGSAILSDTDILLLDEPSTNLDSESISWFRNLLLSNQSDTRLVIIASNEEGDLNMAEEMIDMGKYKK